MVKKRKLKKNVKKILILLVLIVLIVIILLFKRLYKIEKLKKISYDKEAIKYILDKKLYEKIIDTGYSKTINNCVKTKYFDDKYISNYKNISYYKQKDICNNINLLIDRGYKDDEINNIIKSGDNDDINEFVRYDYIESINDYLKYDFSKIKNIKRYISYYEKTSDDFENVVLYVNIGLDKEFYEDVNYITDYKDTLLVNKYSAVTKDYEPKNLSLIDKKFWLGNEVQQASLVAKEAFEKMAGDALKEGIYILANSTYRSYDEQEEIFNEYKNKFGEKYALNYAAKPGFSEHQTGLVIDIASKYNNIFANSKEYLWVKENAYKYGFIERYPKGKEYITGYKYEAWHYRYVGLDIAKYIYENDITYEEYYYRFLDK